VTSNPAESISTLLAILQAIDPNLSKAVSAHLENPSLHSGRIMYIVWSVFAMRESKISGRELSRMVAPSGDFSGPVRLAVWWHYPTLYSAQRDWSHSADTTNPCTRMMLRKGVNPMLHSIAWWELWFRREDTRDRNGKVTPMEDRPDAERQLHENFARSCMEIANPKVILLIGRHVYSAFRSKFSYGRLIDFRAGTTEGMISFDPDGIVDRIAIYCPHPEYLFRHPPPGTGAIMDEAIKFAVELSGLDIPLNATYFTHLEEVFRTRKEVGWKNRLTDSPMKAILTMLTFEVHGGGTIPYDQIQPRILELYTKWTGNPLTDDGQAMTQHLLSLCPAGHVSIVKGLHVLMVLKSVENRKQEGYPSLVKARAAVTKEALMKRDAKRREKAIAAAEEKRFSKERERAKEPEEKKRLAAEEERLAKEREKAESEEEKLTKLAKKIDKDSEEGAMAMHALVSLASGSAPDQRETTSSRAEAKTLIEEDKMVIHALDSLENASLTDRHEATSPRAEAKTLIEEDKMVIHALDSLGGASITDQHETKSPRTKAKTPNEGPGMHHCNEQGCNKTFKYRMNLWMHRQVEHQGTRWFCKWPECTRAYKSPWSVTTHVRNVHAGQEEPPEDWAERRWHEGKDIYI
jgi:DNA segregation ATPase FtsK/SpoIIIE-like protein